MAQLDEYTFLASKDEVVTVTTTKKNKSDYLPPFIMCGDKRMHKNKVAGYPYTDTLLSMSKAEQWFFKLIKANLNYKNNISIIRSSAFNRTELNKISLAFKLLKEKGLIKKTKKEHYIVNPDAIIYPPNYGLIKEVWDNLE
jgi:hypothetical protein